MKEHKKVAKKLIEKTKKTIKIAEKTLEPAKVIEIQKQMETLQECLKNPVVYDLEKQTKALNKLYNQHLLVFQKSPLREVAESIVFGFTAAMIFRFFLLDPMKIPSVSMVPTLEIGDHLLVNKLSYGLWIPFLAKKLRFGQGPQRGEVIVFVYPKDPSKDYIKRVIGIEGDQIEVKENQLYINGKKIEQTKETTLSYKDWNMETDVFSDLSGEVYGSQLQSRKFKIMLSKQNTSTTANWSSKNTTWGPKVPKGFVFVMGDNRDLSSDSRVWGLVPIESIMGRALCIWSSFGGGKGIYWKRFFRSIP